MAKTRKADSTPRPRVVWLGNHNAVERPHDPGDIEAAQAEQRPVKQLTNNLPGKRATYFVVPAEVRPGEPMTLGEAFTTLIHPKVWWSHSDDDAPAWVASSDPLFGQLLAEHWRCELRQPDPDNPTVQAAIEAGYYTPEA